MTISRGFMVCLMALWISPSSFGDHLFIGNNPISRKYSVNLPDGDYIFEPHSRIYKSGWIQRWEVYFSSRDGSVSFQIWRQITSLKGATKHYGPTRYELIGETVSKSASYVGFHIFESQAKTADERLWVLAGDVIGIRFVGGNPIPYSTDEGSCWATNQFLYSNATSLPVGQSRDFLEGSSRFEEPCRKYSVRALVEFGGDDENAEDCLMMFADSKPAILTSPGYPHKYPRDVKVCWVIQSHYAFERIRIDLEDSNLQTTSRNKSCFFTDYVTVRDGPTSDASLLGGWCGGGTPERGSIMSTNPIAFIRFYSDDSVEGSGFKLLYYATKGEEVVLTKSWLKGERLIMFAAGMTMLVTVTFAVSGFSYTRYRSKPSLNMRKRKRKRKDSHDLHRDDCDTDKLIPTVSEEVEMPSGISDTATMLAYNEVLVHPSPPVIIKLHQVTVHPDNQSGGGATGGRTCGVGATGGGATGGGTTGGGTTGDGATRGGNNNRRLPKPPTYSSYRRFMTVCGAEGDSSAEKCVVYSDRKYLTVNASQLTVTNSNANSGDFDENNSDNPSLSFF